jgi:putative transposase
MSRSDNPFRYFNSSPEVIRLVVMMYVRFPLSLRNVEDGSVKATDRLFRRSG